MMEENEKVYDREIQGTTTCPILGPATGLGTCSICRYFRGPEIVSGIPVVKCAREDD